MTQLHHHFNKLDYKQLYFFQCYSVIKLSLYTFQNFIKYLVYNETQCYKLFAILEPSRNLSNFWHLNIHTYFFIFYCQKRFINSTRINNSNKILEQYVTKYQKYFRYDQYIGSNIIFSSFLYNLFTPNHFISLTWNYVNIHIYLCFARRYQTI